MKTNMTLEVLRKMHSRGVRSATANEIAQWGNIRRATVYVTLTRLRKSRRVARVEQRRCNVSGKLCGAYLPSQLEMGV